MVPTVVRTLGVDLASQPAGTALCRIEWDEGRARIDLLRVGATDEDIVAAAEGCERVGIDAPFGWPDAFARTLAEYHARALPALPAWTIERRQAARFRLTDRDVATRLGRPPLSVSSDRIALPAMRCASLLGMLGVRSRCADRRVVEVYPAVALRVWEVAARGSKRESASLVELAGALLGRMPWLRVTDAQEALLRMQHDALDALVSSLVARAAGVPDGVAPMPDEPREVIEREGWIAVPTVPLEALAAPRG